MQERRKTPQADLISALVRADVVGEEWMSHVLAFCVFLFLAGHEATTSSITSGLLLLLANPAEHASYSKISRVYFQPLLKKSFVTNPPRSAPCAKRARILTCAAKQFERVSRSFSCSGQRTAIPSSFPIPTASI